MKDRDLTAPKRILLVDESADIRVLVTLLLADSGYTVMATDSPADAVVQLGRDAFDLVICDGFRGLDVGSRDGSVDVLTAAGGTPVALFTGWPWESGVAETAGYAALLTKPFDIDLFDQRIAQLLNIAATPSVGK